MTLDAVYIVYWSLQDPLTQSQSLPVLRALAGHGYRMGLVTYERQPGDGAGPSRAVVSEKLRNQGIDWYPLLYHRDPPVLSTLWDVMKGLQKCWSLHLSRGVSLFHARGTVPGAPAHLAAVATGARFFYDADGPLSQEYVDAGVWSEGSFGHRLARWSEDRFLRRADAVAVLTQTRRDVVQPVVKRSVSVLPCAVDTSHFKPREEARTHLRSQLGLNGLVFVYAGKWGGWYAVEEMFDFVAIARETFPTSQLLILTQESHEPFLQAARRRNIEHRLLIRTSSREEMPDYLCAADVGLSFVRPVPSKLACSPVKNGEYLACGLPVVTPTGIGDYSALIEKRKVGIVLDNLDTENYRKAAQQLRGLLTDACLTARCQDVARSEVGLSEVLVPRYLAIYEDLLGGPVKLCEQHTRDAAGFACNWK